jgi:hypothetical protein
MPSIKNAYSQNDSLTHSLTHSLSLSLTHTLSLSRTTYIGGCVFESFDPTITLENTLRLTDVGHLRSQDLEAGIFTTEQARTKWHCEQNQRSGIDG